MKYTIILLALILTACQDASTPSEKIEGTANASNEEFTQYISHFDKVELPVIIKGCDIASSDETKYAKAPNVVKYLDQESLIYGQISTNGDYIATITLGAADCYLPVITTYRPDGTVIDKQTIAIGGCGGGCGIKCEEFMTLKKDLSFYTSDTVSVYECDSLGEETLGTRESYILYRKGKLLSNGKIEISEEMKQTLLEVPQK